MRDGQVAAGLALALAVAAARPAPLAAASTLDAGIALYRQGHLAAAAEAFHRAVRERRGQAQPRFWLGITLVRLGRPLEGAEALRAAAVLAPRDGHVWLWWGHALASSGDLPQAERALQRALLLVPRGAEAEVARQGLRAIRGMALGGIPAGAWPPALDPRVYAAMARFYNARLAAEDAQVIAEAILGFSRQYNLDPRLIAAVIAVESGFSPTARSHRGARGLGQLMPETAAALGIHPDDPVQNIYGTVRVLRGNLDHFGWENLHLALAAYNAGKGAVQRYGGIPPYEETVLYVRNVGDLYRRLRVVYPAGAGRV
ncbi:MAG: transglycosylase SLT domain-containing protein [Armatimonadota bacterium]|nr:transglycosylase SLT domain-containing protein [Armatimonadota bacterium]MDR7427638.1 transglycosylase SLT domain-containing protein [Armatimonadota bacterium]MDR7465233.1 transglycosylase SLT domain-containing protein [Armatimonadota bacterium]MDR7470953.1 transglycosylase SLT domain-containing protein [Armatimonadota bacterium]MDR7473585.1 transglycosylase SLT domain-containing protein [Armatimonadota bacterium]